jgi:hypothetical protein
VTTRTTVTEGLQHVSCAGSTLVMSFIGGVHVRLDQYEIHRMLNEVARTEPGILHEALENRLVERIADRMG